MIREIDLVSYLPSFITEFKEVCTALKAENPEFKLAWENIDRILYNEFIKTADEYGISRFEKLLDIFPNAEDSLEDRRKKILIKWFDMIPYTIKMLKKQIALICGEDNFFIFIKHNKYLLYLKLPNIDNTALSEVKEILDKMLPANMLVNILFKNIHEFFKLLKHSEMKMFSHYKLRNDLAERGFLNG